MNFRTIAILLAAAGSLGAGTGDEILRQAAGFENTQDALRQQYFYRDHVEDRAASHADKPGKPRETRDYEILSLLGSPYSKLIARNSTPIPEDESRAAIAEAARQRRTTKAPGGNSGVLDQMLSQMTNTLLREEIWNGRATLVILSESSAAPLRHTWWIDKEDHVVARHEYEVVRKTGGLLPGTTSKAVFAKQGDSPWLRQSMVTDFRMAKEKGGEWMETHQFSDFRKFDVTTTIHFDDEPTQPESAFHR